MIRHVFDVLFSLPYGIGVHSLLLLLIDCGYWLWLLVHYPPNRSVVHHALEWGDGVLVGLMVLLIIVQLGLALARDDGLIEPSLSAHFAMLGSTLYPILLFFVLDRYRKRREVHPQEARD
jgi:hypothetical protein